MSNANKKIIGMPQNTGAVKMELPPNQKMPDEMTPEEQEKFFNEYVTRRECTNFVDGYINNQVIPQIMNAVGKELFCLRSMLTVQQSYLINAGICTEDELVKAYEDYMKEQSEIVRKQHEEIARQQRLQASGIIVPDKTIIH